VAEGAWGYQVDTPLYSSENLLHSVLKMAAANGNYLLNVGPKPDGMLPQEWLRRMSDIGDWLAEHGRSVYGTSGCPLQEESPQMLYTRRGKRLYLHLLAWPDSDRIRLSELRQAPTSARMLKTGQGLEVARQDGKIELRGLPAVPPSWGANVIKMTFGTETMLRPPARATRPEPVPCAPDIRIELAADRAELEGFGFKGSVLRTQVLRPAEIEVKRPAETSISPYWTPEQTAEWRVSCARSGKYRLTIVFACPAPFDGTKYEVSVAGKTLHGWIWDTGGEFHGLEFRDVRLPQGETTIRLRPTKPKYAFYFAQVQGIILESR